MIRKFNMYLLGFLILVTGLAGFLFWPLWVLTVLFCYIFFKMFRNNSGLFQALKSTNKEISSVKQTVREALEEFNQSMIDKQKEKEKEILERTFDDIHEAIAFATSQHKQASEPFIEHAFLSNPIQYQYLRAGKWQNGYPVHVIEDQVSFGYDHLGRHLGIIINEGLTIFIFDASIIVKRFGSYGEFRAYEFNQTAHPNQDNSHFARPDQDESHSLLENISRSMVRGSKEFNIHAMKMKINSELSLEKYYAELEAQGYDVEKLRADRRETRRKIIGD